MLVKSLYQESTVACPSHLIGSEICDENGLGSIQSSARTWKRSTTALLNTQGDGQYKIIMSGLGGVSVCSGNKLSSFLTCPQSSEMWNVACALEEGGRCRWYAEDSGKA